MDHGSWPLATMFITGVIALLTLPAAAPDENSRTSRLFSEVGHQGRNCLRP